MPVKIRATQDRRFRAGHEFGKELQEFADGHFTEEQLERLNADPKLVVVIEPEAQEPKKPTADRKVKTTAAKSTPAETEQGK